MRMRLYSNKNTDMSKLDTEVTNITHCVAEANPDPQLWIDVSALCRKDAEHFINGNVLTINPLGGTVNQLYKQDGVTYYGRL